MPTFMISSRSFKFPTTTPPPAFCYLYPQQQQQLYDDISHMHLCILAIKQIFKTIIKMKHTTTSIQPLGLIKIKDGYNFFQKQATIK